MILPQVPEEPPTATIINKLNQTMPTSNKIVSSSTLRLSRNKPMLTTDRAGKSENSMNALQRRNKAQSQLTTYG